METWIEHRSKAYDQLIAGRKKKNQFENQY